jgi:hypothetical protein
LAHGLIDLLVENNFTLEMLISTNPSELSRILAIDQEIAAIVLTAANKKKPWMTRQRIILTVGIYPLDMIANCQGALKRAVTG